MEPSPNMVNTFLVIKRSPTLKHNPTPNNNHTPNSSPIPLKGSPWISTDNLTTINRDKQATVNHSMDTDKVSQHTVVNSLMANLHLINLVVLLVVTLDNKRAITSTIERCNLCIRCGV